MESSASMRLRILLLADAPYEVTPLARELRRAGFAPAWLRARNEQEYLERLGPRIDLILAGNAPPWLDAPRALRLLRERALDIPIIVVAGAASEETALEWLKQGAADYLLTDRLLRLGPAVERALAERRLRVEKRRAETESLALQAHAQEAWAHATRRTSELEATFEAIADGVIVYDADGRVIRANAAARALIGYDAAPDHLSGIPRERAARYVFRDEHGRPLGEEEWPLQQLLRGEVLQGTDAAEFVMTALDDRELHVSMSGAPVSDRAGQIIGAVAVLRDVTERRRLERGTRDALDALLAMAEALVQGPYESEGAGSVTFPASAIGERVAQLTRSVLACQQVAIISVEPETGILAPVAIAGFAPEYEQGWWSQWETRPRLEDRLGAAHIARLRADEPLLLDRTQPPFSSRTAFGRRIVLMAPLHTGATLAGILSVHHGEPDHQYTADELALARAAGRLAALVIERDRLLHEREEARANELALREANRRMDEFLSIASHELRTPLTTILGMAQLARRRLKSLGQAPEPAGLAATDSLLARTEQQSQRLSQLVNDLLDVSRIQSNHLELRLAACDLTAIVADAVDQQRQTWPTRTITLDGPAEPLVVTADGDRLGQVVTNYLTNALKYSFDHSPVAVVVGVAGTSACVRVRDEGPGLTPAQQAVVWDRFHRVRDIAERAGSGNSGGGLGLGLYISRTIVERHGGQAGVESTPGSGSTFWFTLPSRE